MSALLELSQNIALLLALTFLYSFVYPLLVRFSRRVIEVINGVLFGSFALIAMLQPIMIAPGIFYDGRTVVIAIAGFYSGPIPALIAAGMVCLYRVVLRRCGNARRDRRGFKRGAAEHRRADLSAPAWAAPTVDASVVLRRHRAFADRRGVVADRLQFRPSVFSSVGSQYHRALPAGDAAVGHSAD